jgi:fumarate reductase subunit D
MNKNQPLYMPKGSVRAIITLVLVFTFSLLAAAGQVSTEALERILTLVVGFYFITKNTAPR